MILLVSYLLTNPNAFGQEWFEIGNFAPPGSVLGTLNLEPLPFITDSDERMRIDTAGSVGINTTLPQMRLHVEDGGLVINGNIGANPDLGSGVRVMYIPDRSSLRIGNAVGTQWDSPSVGIYSFAMGNDVLSFGDHTSCLTTNSRTNFNL